MSVLTYKALHRRATRLAVTNPETNTAIEEANLFYYDAAWRLLEERIADGINLAPGSGRLAAFIGHSRPPRPCGGQLGRVIDHHHPFLVVAPRPHRDHGKAATGAGSRRGRPGSRAGSKDVRRARRAGSPDARV